MKSHTLSRLLLALTATFSLAAPLAASASTSDIVGGWKMDTQTFTFLSDGMFFQTDTAPLTDMGHGTYTWDSATGNFTCALITDTNSDKGANCGSGFSANLQVSGNTMTANGREGAFIWTRVTDPSSAIVGSWYGYHVGQSQGNVAFTFYSDGTYSLADEGNTALDPSGHNGVEAGTYTWDAATGAFSSTTLVNTDGEWGISDSICTSARISAGGLTLSCANTSAPSVFSSYTFANAAAVPEPGVYAMMLAGFGIVGFAARRRKNNAVAVA